MSVSVRIPRETEATGYKYMERGCGMRRRESRKEKKEKEIYFKALTHVIMETGQFEIHKAGQPAGKPRLNVYVTVLRQNVFSGKPQLFVLKAFHG